MKVDLRATPLSIDEAVADVTHPGAGGLAIFVGMVRDQSEGYTVEALEYQAYATMALRELSRIGGEIEAELLGVRVAAQHRVGSLRVGEIAVVCAASAPHRAEALTACSELIERIKARVPIWKREIGPGGVTWVGWVDARCAAVVNEECAHASHRHA